MYDNHLARTRTARRTALASLSTLVVTLAIAPLSTARAQDYESTSVIRKISERSEKLELTTNSSRILKLDKNIPRVQVNNPELVAVTPLSATDVQISAKKAGVTQVNLWDEDGNIHTIDVLIYGDARELSVALQTQFPHSSIRVYRYSESLVLTGFVDRPDHVGPIMRLAEDYAPKVINNINVGGVQQILLKVKVMEISRTKLRRLDVDFAYIGSDGGFALNSVNGILSFNNAGEVLTNNADTFSFGIVNNGDRFLGFLDALQENRIAKILAEPNLVAVSGRPAQFNVGGEFPVLIPQSLGTTSIEYKPFGTQIDFLPIVLGNGNIRLEVRPRVSVLDFSIPVDLNGTTLPALNVRQVDTAVEMKAGQTFAIAGLVQEKSVSSKSGLPYISDLPIIGVPFRGTENTVEEVELLILVTPEFVDPMDGCETPCGGPGYATTNPTNRQLYCAGQLEVPTHCNPISGLTACGTEPCGHCNGCAPHGIQGEPLPVITDGVSLPGGTGYDDSTTITDQFDAEPAFERSMPVSEPLRNVPDDLLLPADSEQPDGASYQPGWRHQSRSLPSAAQSAAPGSYTPTRQPVYMRHASNPQIQQPPAGGAAPPAGENDLFGPVGYDLQ